MSARREDLETRNRTNTISSNRQTYEYQKVGTSDYRVFIPNLPCLDSETFFSCIAVYLQSAIINELTTELYPSSKHMHVLMSAAIYPPALANALIWEYCQHCLLSSSADQTLMFVRGQLKSRQLSIHVHQHSSSHLGNPCTFSMISEIQTCAFLSCRRHKLRSGRYRCPTRKSTRMKSRNSSTRLPPLRLP